MRVTWIALAAILGMSLLGAYLLGRALEKPKPRRSLAPRGAHVLAVRPLSDDQRVLMWRIGGHVEDPTSSLYGITVVEGQTRLYTHRAQRGAAGIDVETRDFNRDRRRDVLVVDERKCNTYRLLLTSAGAISEVAMRTICGKTNPSLRWSGRRLVLRG